MAISSETRRAGPFTGNGSQRDFPFAFKVFSADQVKVLTAEKPGGKDVELDSTDYSVTLEADQDSNPGGVVTLSAPLPVGSVLAILSAVPYLQPMTLTNRGGFFPTTLNDSADRAVILAQQNAEILSRCVTVDATDTMTPAELKKALLETAVNAKDYAQKAEKTYNEVIKTQEQIEKVNDNVNEKSDHVDAVKKDIDETADNVKKDITDTAASIKKEMDETAGGIKDLIDNNKESFDAVSTLAPHVDDLTAISGHINEVHKVGQDLMGVNANSLDLGYVTGDPDTITKVIDGYIKKVAEHIDDCVHPVAMSLDSVKAVAKNLEPVNQVVEIMHVDYESIFLNGLPEGD